MPLAASTRLGPYEILAPLGAGGMGEVYRARDTRLGREVAIKVLPQHLSVSPEVRARFDREARTVSSLNHPHICTLFDIGREGETDFLVMELIDGETLAARLERGALPGPEVLRLGAQIADALDRAHRAGVIHRDLKPGNVMLTRAGAKLMDFGLARATGLAGAGGASGLTHAALTRSPTVAAPLTAEGTIVGTFQYMAPEQLEGKEADERSDLWALGCVLYEMATGRRAFEGRSQASLISSIMSGEPAPVSQVAPLAPAGLDRLVRTCLTKDPEERARSAHDVKLQLLGMQEAASGSAAAIPAPPRAAKAARLPWIVAAGASLLAILLAVALTTRDPRDRSPLHVALEPPPNATFLHYASSLAISPDGSSVVYGAVDSSGHHLWLRRFDTPGARLLMTTTSVVGPFWSPDGRTIGVWGNRRRLYTIPVEGGTPTEVCETSASRGATWSSRGVIVFTPSSQSGLFQVPASGGDPVQVTWPDSARGETGHRFPCFLPDGNRFLFASVPAGPSGFDIWVGSLDSREVRKVLNAQSAVIYAAPGYLLFRRAGKLTAQRFDPRTAKVSGNPVPLVDAPPVADLDAEPIASASRNGRLVVLENTPADTRLAWMDLSGIVRGTLNLPRGPWGRPALSPDGRFAAVTNGDDLWRIDVERSVPLRLTSGGGYHNEPVWSPDGSKIAFTKGGQGREEIVVIRSDGSGEPERIPTTDDQFKLASDWIAEGLLFTPIRTRTVRDVVLAPYPPGPPVRSLVAGPFAEAIPKASPDGRWVAYSSNEAGAPPDVYLQSYPQPGRKIRVSSGGAEAFWWMPGSDELCYRTFNRTHLMAVRLTRRGDDLEASEPRVLFRYPAEVEWSDLARDGQRLLVTLSSEGARNRRARVVLNWTTMLEARH